MAEPPLGAWLETAVVYYRQEQHMSYERTQAAMLNLHGVELSQGGIDQMMAGGLLHPNRCLARHPGQPND